MKKSYIRRSLLDRLNKTCYAGRIQRNRHDLSALREVIFYSLALKQAEIYNPSLLAMMFDNLDLTQKQLITQVKAACKALKFIRSVTAENTYPPTKTYIPLHKFTTGLKKRSWPGRNILRSILWIHNFHLQ